MPMLIRSRYGNGCRKKPGCEEHEVRDRDAKGRLPVRVDSIEFPSCSPCIGALCDLPSIKLYCAPQLTFATVSRKLQLLKKYIRYRLRASNSKGHGMHSPFVFEFITRVLNDHANYPAYARVEGLRKKLLQNNKILTIEDMGAGSAVNRHRERMVSDLAKNAAKPRKYGQLLYRMVSYYRPAVVLELGTSLGITTSYLAAAAPEARVITIEGADEVAEVAQENFHSLALDNIRLEKGNFDEVLGTILREEPRIDFAFIDGNHREEPTVRYFAQLLESCGNDTVLVFDDIHWSEEMERAWERIKDHEAVRCTADLFFIGIVWLRKEFLEKQHFTIMF